MIKSSLKKYKSPLIIGLIFIIIGAVFLFLGYRIFNRVNLQTDLPIYGPQDILKEKNGESKRVFYHVNLPDSVSLHQVCLVTFCNDSTIFKKYFSTLLYRVRLVENIKLVIYTVMKSGSGFRGNLLSIETIFLPNWQLFNEVQKQYLLEKMDNPLILALIDKQKRIRGYYNISHPPEVSEIIKDAKSLRMETSINGPVFDCSK